MYFKFIFLYYSQYFRMSIYQEIRLYNNANQREAFDNRAELYSIIKTIQELEVILEILFFLNSFE